MCGVKAQVYLLDLIPGSKRDTRTVALLPIAVEERTHVRRICPVERATHPDGAPFTAEVDAAAP
jgi:hypothetical protein